MKKEIGKKEWIGTFLIILTAIISGIAVAVHKYFIMRIDSLVFTALRALFIGIIFLMLSLYFNRHEKNFTKVSWKWLLLIGVLGGGFAFWMYFSGLKLTLASRAAFIHKTLPLWAGILAYTFLKEKITKRQLIAGVVMILGLVLMEVMSIGSEIRVGDMLVLGATILWAVENTIAKKVMMDKESNWVVTFARMFYGALILFAIILIVGKFHLIFELSRDQTLFVIISGILLFLYVLTYYWGLKHINLSKAATILLLAPVITLVLSMIWLDEKIVISQLIGSILILIGAFVIVRTKSERRDKNSFSKEELVY